MGWCPTTPVGHAPLPPAVIIRNNQPKKKKSGRDLMNYSGISKKKTKTYILFRLAWSLKFYLCQIVAITTASTEETLTVLKCVMPVNFDNYKAAMWHSLVCQIARSQQALQPFCALLSEVLTAVTSHRCLKAQLITEILCHHKKGGHGL